MGNSQSNDDDDDNIPRYNYHERVLRDAQAEFISSADGVDGSGRNANIALEICSQESPLEQPDSSGNTNCSTRVDTERNDSNTGQSEAPELEVSEEFVTNSNTDHAFTARSLSVNCDNIGSTLFNTNERSSKSLKDSVNSNRSDVSICSNSNSEDTTKVYGDHSGSVINLPQGMREEIPVFCKNKRKVSQDSIKEYMLPRKKMLTRSSSKRKRLGYKDSSESETSEKDEDRRMPQKRGRIISQSLKKSKRLDRGSSERDSVEQMFRKYRHIEEADCSCEVSESSEEDAQCDVCIRTYRNQRKQVSSCLKRRRKCCCSDGDDSDGISRRRQMKNFQRHQNSERDGEMMEEETGIKHSYVRSEKMCSTINVADDLQFKKGRVILRGVYNDNKISSELKSSSGNAVSGSADVNISSVSCHTFKMGSQSIRNSLGKVFPMRIQKDFTDSLAAVSHINSENIVENLRPRHSDSVKSSTVEMSKVLHSGKASVNNMSASVSQVVNAKYKGHQVQPESNNLYSIASNCHESPFKNVVLVTPSMSSQSADLRQAVNYHVHEDSSDMEVDESNTEMSKKLNSQFFNCVPSCHRIMPESKPRPKTVSSKFRQFWSEKKANFGRNVVKPDVVSEKPQNFISSTWQVFPSQMDSSDKSHGVTGYHYDKPGTSAHLINSICNKLQHSSLAAASCIEWLPQTAQCQVLHFRLLGAVDVSISIGDIADQKTAGIVNWTDGALTHTITSCSRSIAAKAGALMREACNDYIANKRSNLVAPDVVTTVAGGRFEKVVKTILHVVEPNWIEGNEEKNRHALMEVFANCLTFAKQHLGLNSISFPLIGEGRFPFVICVQSFFDALLIFLTEKSETYGSFHVHLIIPDITAANLAANIGKSYLECASLNESMNVLSHNWSCSRHDTNHVSRKETELSIGTNLQKNFTVERTTSGRPRLKRPRL